MADSKAEKVQDPKKKDTELNNTRLNLLDKICRNVRSVEQKLPVISNITEMTRYALNASASSLILLDEEDKELLYNFVDGPLGKQLGRLQMNNQTGIYGWVIRNGKPLIVKDVNIDERFSEFKYEVSGLVTRSVICAPLVIHGVVIGVIEVLNKLDGNDFDEHDLLTLVQLATNSALTIENVRLNESLLYSYKSTVQKLVSQLDIRENSASKHSRRVAEYALIGAARLSLSEKEKKTIEYAAILHDIGLLSIPGSILNKRDILTQEEWNLIRKHPVIGSNILRGIPSLNQVSKVILYHHERYDGKGYPCGLKGENIPIGARLIAVADAFDSMTVKHSYRAAMSKEDALAELGRCSGSQFCPVAAKAFFLSFIKSHPVVRQVPSRSQKIALEL
ncbi:HD domain-containing phosphohydrolase [Chloroflexota bacterium]